MPNVIYIAGSGRSGSTILGDVLGSVRGCYHLGEVQSLWDVSYPRNYKCGCGTNLRKCDFWRSVLDSVSQNGTCRLVNRMQRLLGEAPRTHSVPVQMHMERGVHQELSSLIARFYEVLKVNTGATLLVDSSKSPAYLNVLSQTHATEVYVIHLVRDARAVAYSWIRKAIRGFRLGISSCAMTWLMRNSVLEYWAWNNPDRYIQLKYEDFATSPRSTVSEMLSWMGIDAENPVSKEDSVHLPSFHSAWGNPSRFGDGQAVIRLDNEWIEELPFYRRKQVEAITWPLLYKYGYLKHA